MVTSFEKKMIAWMLIVVIGWIMVFSGSEVVCAKEDEGSSETVELPVEERKSFCAGKWMF